MRDPLPCAAFGHIWTFGDNTYGQLGVGHFRQQRGAKRVASTLLGKQIIHASCGDSFTIVATGGKKDMALPGVEFTDLPVATWQWLGKGRVVMVFTILI